jgi:hypothetical protein
MLTYPLAYAKMPLWQVNLPLDHVNIAKKHVDIPPVKPNLQFGFFVPHQSILLAAPSWACTAVRWHAEHVEALLLTTLINSVFFVSLCTVINL